MSCLLSATLGGVLLQDLASDIQVPPFIKLLKSLLLTLGSLFGLEAGQVQGLQAYRVQPNRQRKLNSDRQKGISWLAPE